MGLVYMLDESVLFVERDRLFAMSSRFIQAKTENSLQAAPSQ